MKRTLQLEFFRVQRSLYALLSAVIVLLTCHVPSVAQSVSSTVPLLQKHGYLLVVPITLNGVGPFNFIVDTGSSITMVDTDLFRQLGLVERGKQPISGVLEMPSRSWAIAKEIRVGDASVSDLPVVSMDRMFLPDSRHTISGILGENFLDRFDLLIDNQAKTITFSSDAVLASRMLGIHLPMSTTSAIGGERFRHRPLLSMTIPSYSDRPVPLLLDSGAEIFTVLTSTLLRTRPRDGGPAFRSSITVLGGALPCSMWGGTVTAQNVSLSNLRITVCARTTGDPLDNEGSLPTILFKRIFIGHLHSYVILNPNVLKPTEIASDATAH